MRAYRSGLARLLAADARATKTASDFAGTRPAVRHVAYTAGRAGEHALVWLLIGAAGSIIDDSRRTAWARSTAQVALAHATAVTLKRAFRRSRPVHAGRPAVASEHSFPSAHATSSMAAVAAYRGLVPLPVTAMAASGVISSRLLQGVHYPSDLIAGAVLGLVVVRCTRGAT